MVILPLFWKEILEGLKKKRTYAFRGVYVGVLFFALVVLWPGSSELAAGSGERLVELMFWLQFIIVAVITPVLTATTITAEKQAGSLELLLLTRFSGIEIILGKFLSRAVQLAMLLLCALPIFSLVINIGGVDLRTILAGFAIITAMIVLCGIAGIWCAVHCKSIQSAAMAAYFVIAIVLYPSPTGIKWLGAGALPQAAAGEAAKVIPDWAPSLALGQILDPPPGTDITWFWLRPVILCSVAGLLLFLGSSWSLRSALTRGPSAVSPTMLNIWQSLARARDKLAGGGDLDRQIEKGNPVIWREIRMRTLPNSIATMMAYVATLAAVGIVAFAGYSRGVKGLRLHVWLAIAFNGVLAIGASVLAGTAFVREKEGRTMQSVLTSLLTAREIIEGKEEGLRRCMRLGVAMMILYVTVLALIRTVSPTPIGGGQNDNLNIIAAIGCITMGFFCVRFYIVQALYWSMRSANTTRALVITLLVTVIELTLGSFVPIVAFLNPVACSLFYSGSVGGKIFRGIGLVISYLLYRWIVTQWLHKILVTFQKSVETVN